MLLERSDQLAALAEALAEARDSSRGTLALVAGEAGVGKTSLVRELTRAEAPQARVLWGTCDALFTPAPLAPLVDVAEQVGGSLAELVEREARPYHVVSELVQELRARAPTILVLEDVHWADEATLDVLRLLGRKLSGVPALAIAPTATTSSTARTRSGSCSAASAPGPASSGSSSSPCPGGRGPAGGAARRGRRGAPSQDGRQLVLRH